LLANAAELRHMARTATTADVVKALTTLADRYTKLAAKPSFPGRKCARC
jgi:hypothetical protein